MVYCNWKRGGVQELISTVERRALSILGFAWYVNEMANKTPLARKSQRIFRR